MKNVKRPPRVLVTGSGGFLGRYIVAHISALGYKVIGLDRRPVAEADPARRHLAEWHHIGLPSPDLHVLLEHLRPDALIHAAGPASVPHSITDPAIDFQGSAEVYFQVLDCVRRNAPECRVVLLSSAAVYGNPLELPVKEDVPLHPISPYGFHKLICEKLTEEFRSIYNMRVCSVRIFSAYGPGLSQQVLWDICKKARNHADVKLLGTGEETRDFIHARDVAQGLAIILERGRFDGEAYNLGTGEETKICDLARMVVMALGRNPQIQFEGSMRPGDPLRWRADIAHLSKLGYYPRISITEGVKDYAQWVLSNFRTVVHTQS